MSIRTVGLTRMADVAAKPLEWIWQNRIPRGKVTTFAGDPGLGKSLLTLDIAARISTGTPWPDCRGRAGEPRSVLLLSGEDDPEDTIKPRLMAAGADCSKVVLVGMVSDPDANGKRAMTLADVDLLETAVREVADVQAVIIDPVSQYVGSVDSHRNSEVRGLLGPLAALAQRCCLGIITVTHFNKSAGGRAMYKLMESLAFIAQARAGWAVVSDPGEKGRVLFLPIKSNLGPGATGLAYRVRASEIAARPDLGRHPVVAWESEAITLTADEILTVKDGNAASAAMGWLRTALAAGPKPAKDLQTEAKAAGLSWASVRRALLPAGAKPFKRPGQRNSPWYYRLQSEVAQPDTGTKVEQLEQLDILARVHVDNIFTGGGGGNGEVAQDAQVAPLTNGEQLHHDGLTTDPSRFVGAGF